MSWPGSCTCRVPTTPLSPITPPMPTRRTSGRSSPMGLIWPRSPSSMRVPDAMPANSLCPNPSTAPCSVCCTPPERPSRVSPTRSRGSPRVRRPRSACHSTACTPSRVTTPPSAAARDAPVAAELAHHLRRVADAVVTWSPAGDIHEAAHTDELTSLLRELSSTIDSSDGLTSPGTRAAASVHSSEVGIFPTIATNCSLVAYETSTTKGHGVARSNRSRRLTTNGAGTRRADRRALSSRRTGPAGAGNSPPYTEIPGMSRATPVRVLTSHNRLIERRPS